MAQQFRIKGEKKWREATKQARQNTGEERGRCIMGMGLT
jgi:hypothetical protein